MYNTSKTKTQQVILPTNDLNFKRVFASPEHIEISKGFLQDLAAYDPLGFLEITHVRIETPYNFQEVNRLSAEHDRDMMLTEVDYACYDESGIRFMLEMQKKDQSYLEERVAYNVGQKYAQLYANDPDSKAPKYVSLKPVIAVIILEANHFDDEIAVRFLRPYDSRFNVYKKNLNLGLEIYVELNKDTSQLPTNLQLWIEYFKTGKVCEEAPCYLQEAAKMVEMISFTKEERELAERIERAQQTRLLEDYTVKLKHEEAMAKVEAEMVKVKSEIESMEAEKLRMKAENWSEKLEIARSLLKADMPAIDVAKHVNLPIEDVNALLV